MKILSYKPINKSVLIVGVLLLLPSINVYAAMDFTTMVSAMRDNAGPIIRIVVATAYVIGLWFIFSSMVALKKIGQSTMMHHYGVGGPIVKFVVGILLIYLPSTIDVTVWTLWGHTAIGSGANSLMSYPLDGGDPFGPMKEGAVAIVRVVGYVSFVRGLIILSRAGDQNAGHQGGVGKGMLHIIGGILAINIVETVKLIDNTLGITTF